MRERVFTDEASALAHLSGFFVVAEQVRRAVADAGVSLLDLLNGNKASSVAAVRGALVRLLTEEHGLTRTEIARVLCVTTTCVGSFLPRTRKRDVVRRHGLSYMAEYRAWQTMRLRCTNPENPAYSDYGGRGIWVCARWLDSPENFLADMGRKPSPKHEIDRIDNDKGYTCGHCDDCKVRGAVANCRWVTRDVNDRNRRSNRLIEFGGETLPLVAWAERLGMRAETIGDRIDKGWSAERALTEPVHSKAPNGSRPIKDPSEPHGNTKYPSDLLLAIHRERQEGASVPSLAKRHGISCSYLKKILRGEKRGTLVTAAASAAEGRAAA